MVPNTTGEFGIPIPLPDTLSYEDVNVEVSWEELKVLSTFVGVDAGIVNYNNIKLNLYLAIDGNETQSGKKFYSNGSNTNTTGGFTVVVNPPFDNSPKNLTFTKDSLSLVFNNEGYQPIVGGTLYDDMTATGFWDPAPLKISLKNLVVTISKPASD